MIGLLHSLSLAVDGALALLGIKPEETEVTKLAAASFAAVCPKLAKQDEYMSIGSSWNL